MTCRGARNGKDSAIARARKTGNGATGHEQFRLTVCERQSIEADATAILGQKQYCAGIRSPLHMHCGMVKLRRQRAGFSTATRVKRDVPLIVVGTVGVAGTVGEPFAVRRIDRGRVVGAGRRGQHLLATRGQVDGHDVTLVHEIRLRGQVSRDRQLPTVGRNVEILCRRFPWQQREVESCQQVLAVSAAHIAGEHVRFPAVGQPVIPEARRCAFGHVRLHFRITPFLQSFFLRSIRFQFRPDKGNECNPTTIGKPLDRGRARRDLGHALRLAAVGCDSVHLRLGVILALGRERDPAAIGRPARFAVLVPRGEPSRPRDRCDSLAGDARLAEARREQPQLRPAFVGIHCK